MALTRHPMLDLVYNDETGRYIAVLERQILNLTLSDMKKSALLELLTGDNYDDFSFKDNGDDGELRKIATDALERRTGVSREEAATLVQQRWEDNNPPEPDASTAKYLIGPDPNAKPTRTVPRSQPATNPQPYDVRKHLAGLERAAKNRESYRDQL